MRADEERKNCAQYAEAEHARAPQAELTTCAGSVGFTPPPGLLPPPGLPSHGSCLHGTGSCRPCMWFWKAAGCGRGEDCLHCHLCLPDEISARKCRRRKVRVAERKALQCDESDTSAGPVSNASDASSHRAWSPSVSPGASPRQAVPWSPSMDTPFALHVNRCSVSERSY